MMTRTIITSIIVKPRALAGCAAGTTKRHSGVSAFSAAGVASIVSRPVPVSGPNREKRDAHRRGPPEKPREQPATAAGWQPRHPAPRGARAGSFSAPSLDGFAHSLQPLLA